MSTQAVRIPSDAPLEDVIARTNRWLDVLMGNTGGRIRLRGDDGLVKNIRGGAVLTSGAFTIDASSLAGNQANLLHSNGSTVVLRAQDAGVLTAVPLSAQSTLAVTGAATLSSTLAVTGASTLTGALAANGGTTTTTLHATGAATLDTTLAVTGATTLTGALTANGAITLGDAAADAITVTGTATFAQLATFTLGLTAVGPLTANGAVTLGDALADAITITGTIAFRSAGAASTLTMTLGRTGIDGYLGVAGVAGDLAFLSAVGDTVLRGQAGLILGTAGESAIRIAAGPKLGFFATAAIVKPTVTGAKAGNAALTSLMTALANLGLVTDSTS